MIWHSLNEFFSMGGRGIYVWGSYGLSFLLIGFELWLLGQRRKTVLKRLYALQRLKEN